MSSTSCFVQCGKNILLFKSTENYSSVNSLGQDEIMKKLVQLGVFDNIPKMDMAESLDKTFNLFTLISEALLRCKKEF